MATDSVLLDLVRAGSGGIWRTYRFDTPTVSFGRHERTVGRFDPASLAAAGIAAVRRPTGGRALLHASDLTYSVAMPLAREWSWQDAYAMINGVLLRALRAMGIDAELAEQRVHPLADALCFAAPSPGEIVVGQAKLVGSAVWRRDGAYLQHGSILLHDAQALLVAASGHRVEAPPAAATLGSLLAARGMPAAEEAIRAAFALHLGNALAADSSVTAFTAPASMSTQIDHAAQRLGSADWLWRR